MSKAAMERILASRASGVSPTQSNPEGFGVNPKARDQKFQVASTSSLKFACTLPVEHRNRRSVWTIGSEPFKDAHFATFPPSLIRPCILATSRPGDLVMDPFAGSGTTGRVAIEEGRRATLVELNPEYVAMIRNRCSLTPGLGI
ncbi:MAG: site-specific DNA-methyltransferase [Verrucomicrobiales bacterium]|nr:site-specific DNA-methyltransferase [Verrucomicrobiales bacterium]